MTLELIFSKLEFAGSGWFSQIRSHIIHHLAGFRGSWWKTCFSYNFRTQIGDMRTFSYSGLASYPGIEGERECLLYTVHVMTRMHLIVTIATWLNEGRVQINGNKRFLLRFESAHQKVSLHQLF